MLLPFYGGRGNHFVVNGRLLLAFFYLVVIGTSLTFSLYLNGAEKLAARSGDSQLRQEPLSSARCCRSCWASPLRYRTGSVRC